MRVNTETSRSSARARAATTMSIRDLGGMAKKGRANSVLINSILSS